MWTMVFRGHVTYGHVQCTVHVCGVCVHCAGCACDMPCICPTRTCDVQCTYAKCACDVWCRCAVGAKEVWCTCDIPLWMLRFFWSLDYSRTIFSWCWIRFIDIYWYPRGMFVLVVAPRINWINDADSHWFTIHGWRGNWNLNTQKAGLSAAFFFNWNWFLAIDYEHSIHRLLFYTWVWPILFADLWPHRANTPCRRKHQEEIMVCFLRSMFVS